MCCEEKLRKWEVGEQSVFTCPEGKAWGGEVGAKIWMKLGMSHAGIGKKRISKQRAKLNDIRCLRFLEVIFSLARPLLYFSSIIKIILSIQKVLEKFYLLYREGWRSRRGMSTWNGEWKCRKCRNNRNMLFLLFLPHRNVWQALHSVLATFTGLPSECTAQTQGIVPLNLVTWSAPSCRIKIYPR